MGGTIPYQYYAINVDSITDKYFGKISIAQAPGHANSLFTIWVSKDPGGAPLSDGCKGKVGYDSIISWGKNLGSQLPSYACSIEDGTYYVNVSDGYLPGNKGSCTQGIGCSYLMNVSATKQR